MRATLDRLRGARLGAAAVALGSLLAVTGIDRLGLVSEAAPTIFNTLSQLGIVTTTYARSQVLAKMAEEQEHDPSRRSGFEIRVQPRARVQLRRRSGQ